MTLTAAELMGANVPKPAEGAARPARKPADAAIRMTNAQARLTAAQAKLAAAQAARTKAFSAYESANVREQEAFNRVYRVMVDYERIKRACGE